MIARVWRGAVAAADGDAYAGYLEETAGGAGDEGSTLLRGAS